MRNSVRKLRKCWVLSNDLLKIMVVIATILMQNEIQQFLWYSILEPNHATFVQTYPLGYQFEILKIRSNYCLSLKICFTVACDLAVLWKTVVFCFYEVHLLYFVIYSGDQSLVLTAKVFRRPRLLYFIFATSPIHQF